jgi:hypothetical protein
VARIQQDFKTSYRLTLKDGTKITLRTLRILRTLRTLSILRTSRTLRTLRILRILRIPFVSLVFQIPVRLQSNVPLTVYHVDPEPFIVHDYKEVRGKYQSLSAINLTTDSVSTSLMNYV